MPPVLPSYIANCADTAENPGIPCADPSDEIKAELEGLDYPYYVGHAEPALLFFSWAPNSASDLRWRFTLPATDPSPTQNGSSVANFELFSTFWLSLAMCDPTSRPFGPCVGSSYSNDPTGAGTAFTEVQFYPPGIGASTTSWSAALTIDSIHNTVACAEPITSAFITTNGSPSGAPFLMANGHDILVTMKDTSAGLRVDLVDATTFQSGFMVASAANNFFHNAQVNAVKGSCSGNHSTLCANDTDCPAGQGTCSFCQTETFNFHPLFATASSNHPASWTSLQANVSLAYEVGHWELCGNASCSILPDGDTDDVSCSTIRGIGGCGGDPTHLDADQDGVSYQSKWPDGTAAHPGSLILSSVSLQGVGPMNATTAGSYIQGYDEISFRDTESKNAGTAFYPFFSMSSSGPACRFNFGNDIPGVTTNDFSQAGQYTVNPPVPDANIISNPCFPDLSWIVPAGPLLL